MPMKFLKQMPMKIETPTDSDAVGEDQDMVLKRVVVDPYITITNPNKEMLIPQVIIKARTLCRNMTVIMPTTDVA